MKVKIIGAGSIGNHLTQASRRHGWEVDVVDTDASALQRMKNEIYPTRYGEWDKDIGIYQSGSEPKGEYDIIMIGTPPDVHLPLALAAIEEQPRALQIEKPVCGPSLEDAQTLLDACEDQGVACFVGYDHVVSEGIEYLTDLTRNGSLGTIKTIDVTWREEWSGIFQAHPWLSGPDDSYLGFWQRGGGAGGEHSHGINLWQHLAQTAGGGRVSQVSAQVTYVDDGQVAYDDCCACNLLTSGGIHGRVVQDVLTVPARKEVLIVGENGNATWRHGYGAKGDIVTLEPRGEEAKESCFPKHRPDDFLREVLHIDDQLTREPADSPLALKHGLDTMLVVAAAHRSQAEGRRITIDPDAGYTLNALN